MPESFYHVLAAVGDAPAQVLFSDMTQKELVKNFVTPYRRDKAFFAGTQIVNPSELRTVRIIETAGREAEERERINLASLAQIEEGNRSSGVIICSIGQGYEPEDLQDAGADVTRMHLRAGPGSSTSIWGLSKTVVGWTLGIAAGVIVTGLAKWLGLA
ncbi:hypothetical protein KY495_17550 [Massilia sp. PAMC28688]|uniref:hypothetical protein n=1 Tax=Massilia sp. PAMC28688 TaxID=2861283 RepID=UPI001C62B9FE|nr:hypothetical protein [Massilia sp. PAMC28688]QYF92534.1 hypothetical protein KY495_17550 [Massilia sp. PAMC28688]